MKTYFVYILTNEGSSNLASRVWKHKNKTYDGFTAKYNISKLVYFESTNEINEAIGREKRLKKWKREYKIKLITKFNPKWEDLYKELL